MTSVSAGHIILSTTQNNDVFNRMNDSKSYGVLFKHFYCNFTEFVIIFYPRVNIYKTITLLEWYLFFFSLFWEAR